jgi:macrolide-specific efflux system membrane fusion protein
MKNVFSKIRNFVFKRKRLSLIILVVVIALVFLAKQLFFKTNTPTYQTAKVEKGSIISTISVSGQVATAGNIPITSQASGVVKNIFVKNGDHVTTGQNLVEITTDQQSAQRQAQAWASYLQAKTSLDNANTAMFTLQSDMLTKWKTFTDLAQSGQYQNGDGSPRNDERQLPQFMSVQDDWLATEAKYKTQQGVIAQSQAALNSSWLSYQAVSPMIQSPVDGTVQNITLVPGMTVSATLNSQGTAAVSQKIASVITGNQAVAQFSLSEIDVNKVKDGQKATITLDALPDMTFTGSVVGIDTSGVVSSGVTNYPITIQFDSPIEKILPNMSASANIITDSKDNVLLVPSAAIQSQNGQSFVRILKNNTATETPVEIGISSDTQTEIVSGVKEGEDVVTSIVNTATTSNTRSVFSQGAGGFGGGGALRAGGR